MDNQPKETDVKWPFDDDRIKGRPEYPLDIKYGDPYDRLNDVSIYEDLIDR